MFDSLCDKQHAIFVPRRLIAKNSNVKHSCHRPDMSRFTPRARPSLTHRTMPWYPVMAHGSVTGCPATTTMSWGCWMNTAQDPDREKRKKYHEITFHGTHINYRTRAETESETDTSLHQVRPPPPPPQSMSCNKLKTGNNALRMCKSSLTEAGPKDAV